MKLYGYFRSSAAYRVRIALNLKGVAYRQIAVNLREGAQFSDEYRMLNPQGMVPTLETEDGQRLTQSLAICEYLEERYPQTPLLPEDSLARARVRALANVPACEMHPLNNLRVLKYLIGELGLDDDTKRAWYHHWIAEGFTALEAMLTEQAGSGEFCHGDQPGLADICLIPQVYNAQRFGCELADYPTIMRIAERCNGLPAFAEAHPDRQPDSI